MKFKYLYAFKKTSCLQLDICWKKCNIESNFNSRLHQFKQKKNGTTISVGKQRQFCEDSYKTYALAEPQMDFRLHDLFISKPSYDREYFSFFKGTTKLKNCRNNGWHWVVFDSWRNPVFGDGCGGNRSTYIPLEMTLESISNGQTATRNRKTLFASPIMIRFYAERHYWHFVLGGGF